MEVWPQGVAKKALQMLEMDDLVSLGYIQEGRCPGPAIQELVPTPCKTRHDSALRGQNGYDTTDKKAFLYDKCM